MILKLVQSIINKYQYWRLDVPEDDRVVIYDIMLNKVEDIDESDYRSLNKYTRIDSSSITDSDYFEILYKLKDKYNKSKLVR